MAVQSPTVIVSPGTVSGLDLTNLQHMHMQLDPGGFGTQDAYTIAWNDLRLIGTPIKITSQSYNKDTQEFTITWTSRPDKVYTVLYSSALGTEDFYPIVGGIWSAGETTTATFAPPAGAAGFFRVQQD